MPHRCSPAVADVSCELWNDLHSSAAEAAGTWQDLRLHLRLRLGEPQPVRGAVVMADTGFALNGCSLV